jgi:hypothetical protein
MNCESARLELVECARRGGGMPFRLSEHMAACDSCRESWRSQQELSGHLRELRIAGIPEGHEWGKAVLLREFDGRRWRIRQGRWMWALSTAALLTLSVFAVRDIRGRRGDETGAVITARILAPREYPEETFTPAEEAGEKGFIKLPFALPPAPGETFGIVRTELDPAQLVRMGVRVDPGWTGTVEADVLVGQDGLAQAVRLSSDEDASGTTTGY